MHHDQEACGANEPIDVVAIIAEHDNFTSLGEAWIRESADGYGPPPGPWTDEIAQRADTNSCKPDYAETTDDDGVLHRIYTCVDARLELYRFPGPHVWPGTGPGAFGVGDFEANEVIRDFLELTP